MSGIFSKLECVDVRLSAVLFFGLIEGIDRDNGDFYSEEFFDDLEKVKHSYLVRDKEYLENMLYHLIPGFIKKRVEQHDWQELMVFFGFVEEHLTHFPNLHVYHLMTSPFGSMAEAFGDNLKDWMHLFGPETLRCFVDEFDCLDVAITAANQQLILNRIEELKQNPITDEEIESWWGPFKPRRS